MRRWLFLPVLCAARSHCIESEGDAAQLLQSSRHLPVDRSPEAIREMVDQLAKAKKECLATSLDCLGALKQVRYRVWPYVQELIHWNANPWEPQGFHPEVVKAQMNCNGDSNYTVMLLHMWKAAGLSSMANLEAVSKNSNYIKSYLGDYRWCDSVGFNAIDENRRAVFTFVREPLERFVSGYAEIERTYRPSWLSTAEKGTFARAKVFIDRFFADGAVFNGHVKPQSEFFVPLASDCSMEINFVGKTEHMSEDWRRFMESKHCEAASIPYNNNLGQHPTNDTLKDTMSNLLNEALLSTDISLSTEAAVTSLRSVLQANGYAYLRAICWIHLIDYIMFDYDLPKQCQEPELLHVMKEAKIRSTSAT